MIERFDTATKKEFNSIMRDMKARKECLYVNTYIANLFRKNGIKGENKSWFEAKPLGKIYEPTQ